MRSLMLERDTLKKVKLYDIYCFNGWLWQGHKEYYQAELDLNAKLRTFAVNSSLLYGGHNTVQAQLKCKSKRRQWSSFLFIQK